MRSKSVSLETVSRRGWSLARNVSIVTQRQYSWGVSRRGQKSYICVYTLVPTVTVNKSVVFLYYHVLFIPSGSIAVPYLS